MFVLTYVITYSLDKTNFSLLLPLLITSLYFFFIGGEITVPVPSPASHIRAKVKQMLDEGTLTLGEILDQNNTRGSFFKREK